MMKKIKVEHVKGFKSRLASGTELGRAKIVLGDGL